MLQGLILLSLSLFDFLTVPMLLFVIVWIGIMTATQQGTVMIVSSLLGLMNIYTLLN